jgi:hypothetical protein
MYDMLSKTMIDSLVFSFDFRHSPPQIKFGAHDDTKQVLQKGERIKKINTITADKWQIKVKEASIMPEVQI